MASTLDPQVQWVTAAPLWPQAAANPGQMQAPALLRFASDSFIDEFMATLDIDPARLGSLQAQWETWREPIPPVEPVAPALGFERQVRQIAAGRANAAAAPGALATTATNRTIASGRRVAAQATAALTAARAGLALASSDVASQAEPLTLYQPVHQRYYLLAAQLVCRVPGLPDRVLDVSAQERVTFVVRRLLPSTTAAGRAPDDLSSYQEYAFVTTGGASTAGWQAVSATPGGAADILAPGEEQLPLFPAGFTADDGRRRRLYSGLVPVARREAYMGAPARPAALPAPGADRQTALLALFRAQVREPWQNLIDLVARTNVALEAAGQGDNVTDQENSARVFKDKIQDQIEVGSWYILLDFAQFLQKHLPDVWAMIESGSGQGALFNWINGVSYTRGSTSIPLRQALVQIVASAGALESIPTPYDVPPPPGLSWPGFTFDLAVIPAPSWAGIRPDVQPRGSLSGVNLTALDAALLATTFAGQERVPAVPLAAQLPAAAGDPGWFVIRCVFERPECGPLLPPVISRPTQVFQMAGYFDPNTPARAIRIAMPLDITPAGLRKFDKNTVFQLSDALCGRLAQMDGLSLGDLVLSVLPWPFHKDLPGGGAPCANNAGQLCTMSIPIITICAMILLMIIVKLFDIIFNWMMFFRICLPLPGLKAKG